MNYLVAYTLKHKEYPDSFVDHWMPFLESEGHTFESAKKYYSDIIAKDGGEDDWSLFTINISGIIKSSDY